MSAGYNLTAGGGGTSGYKHTEEEIKKMRQIQKPKKVLQLDQNLKIINTWDSCSHAGKTLNMSSRGIKACCDRTNYQKTIGGFFWVYKEDFESPDFDKSYFTIKARQPKRVGKFDLSLNLLEVYPSVTEASNQTGYDMSSISSVCLRKRKTCHSFIFRYVDFYTDEEKARDKQMNFLKPDPPKNHVYKKVYQYDKEGNYIKEYSSAKQAAEELKLKTENIQYCCNGHSKTSGGYIWKYEKTQ